MNAKLVAIVIGFVAGHAYAADQNGHAALSTVDVHAKAPLVVDCHHETLPSRNDVAQVLDTNNASAIYAGREKVAHYAHRECMRGAGYVAFVRDDTTAPASLALAAARP